jgi:hypothetical protein
MERRDEARRLYRWAGCAKSVTLIRWGNVPSLITSRFFLPPVRAFPAPTSTVWGGDRSPTCSSQPNLLRHDEREHTAVSDAIAQMANGGLTILVSHTADNLRHIHILGATLPRAPRTAGRAVDLILREPFVPQC